jgi:hypothetical protein
VPRLRSPALVLRRWPFSETSLTLRVLTPEEGTLGLLAKGVNRVGSGSFAVLDTWALVEIEYGGRPEAELLNLYSARLLDRNAGLERDPERLAALAAQPAAQDPATVLVPALLRGLHWFGLAPMLDAPAPAPGDRCWFSPEAGGVVHAPRRPHEHARLLHSGTLALLRRLAAARVPAPARADAPSPASEPWDESLTILVEFLHYHAERAPRAWPLLQERRRRRKRTA